MNLKTVKKALIINPPSGLYRRDDRCQSKVEDQTVRVILPPINLAYMAAILRQDRVECLISDYPTQGGTFKDLEHDLLHYQPDILFFNLTTASVRTDLQTCHIAKAVNPDIVTVAFGGYLIKFDRDTMAGEPLLDLCIRGEYEAVLSDLISGADFQQIPGLTYRQGDDIVQTQGNPVVHDLDTLPLPARDLINNSLYVRPDINTSITTILTSRGCPYHCIFCPVGDVSGPKVRFRSPASILLEIDECLHKYEISVFLFNADTFTLNRKWVIELCQGIIDNKFNISWAANSRVDTVDRERLEWMKKAGCTIVGFGAESGSQKMLDKMEKKITTAQIKDAVKLCREVGLLSHTFYIIGLPWEDRQTLAETYQFARDVDADFFDFNIAFPLPGTKFYDLAVEHNLFINNNLEAAGYANSPIRSFHVSHQELLKFRQKALLKLYFRPRYIVRTLSRLVTRPKEFKNYLRLGVTRARQLIFHQD